MLVAAAVFLAGCTNEVEGDAQVIAADAAARSAGAELVPDDDAVVQDFMAELATRDRSLLDKLVPESMAYTFVEGRILLFEGGQVNQPDKDPLRVADGWQLGDDNVTFSHFQVDRDGRIRTFTRNGRPIEEVMAAGDGTTYTVSPTGVSETWTGSVKMTIQSFRIFGENLYIYVTTVNDSSSTAEAYFKDYAVGGERTADASGHDPTPPGETRTTVSTFTHVSGAGGKAYGRINVEGSPGMDLTVEVPQIG